MMALKEILKSLPKLGQSDLSKIELRLSGLIKPNQLKIDSDEKLVHDRLNLVLRDQGLSKLPPLHALYAAGHYRKYKDGVIVLMEFVVAHFKPRTRGFRAKAVTVCLQVMANRARELNLPVTHKTITYQLDKVSNVIEKQFPGYRASGMLPMVLARSRS